MPTSPTEAARLRHPSAQRRQKPSSTTTSRQPSTPPSRAGAETLDAIQSPSPMRIYAYQLFSGNADANPKGWSLQASNDGQNWETLHTEADTTFSVRGQRYFAEVPTTKDYTYYRLLFDCDDTQTQFSLSEWQLLGRCIDDHDLTTGIEDITEGYEALTDHVGTTVFTTPLTATLKTTGNNTLTAYSITIGDKAQRLRRRGNWKARQRHNTGKSSTSRPKPSSPIRTAPTSIASIPRRHTSTTA